MFYSSDFLRKLWNENKNLRIQKKEYGSSFIKIAPPCSLSWLRFPHHYYTVALWKPPVILKGASLPAAPDTLPLKLHMGPTCFRHAGQDGTIWVLSDCMSRVLEQVTEIAMCWLSAQRREEMVWTMRGGLSRRTREGGEGKRTAGTEIGVS